MPKVTKIHTVFLLVLFCFSSASFGAKFFKWTDENGNIHYSDKEPVKQNSEAVHVNASKPSKSAKPAPKFTVDKEQERSNEEPGIRDEQEKQMQKFCQGLQSNIKTLEMPIRVESVDETGERKFLDDKEKSQKLERYRQQYSEHCS